MQHRTPTSRKTSQENHFTELLIASTVHRSHSCVQQRTIGALQISRNRQTNELPVLRRNLRFTQLILLHQRPIFDQHVLRNSLHKPRHKTKSLRNILQRILILTHNKSLTRISTPTHYKICDSPTTTTPATKTHTKHKALDTKPTTNKPNTHGETETT